MRQYILQVTINEGNDEFWEYLSGTGTDEVEKIVWNALANEGFVEPECLVKMISFKRVGEE